jgi:uncharacterized protein YcbK (DUF882 family)
MHFRVVAVCVTCLSAVLGVDFAICRDTSVLARLASPKTAARDAHAVASAPAPAPIVVTPLPDLPITVTLRNVNSEEMGVFAIPSDGQTDAATAAALKHFLRCQRTGREHAMAPGLLAMLASVAQQWPG